MSHTLGHRISGLYALLSGILLVSFLGIGAAAQTQCSNPANAIVAENCHPGNDDSEWDVSTGDAGDPTIQGFASDISYNVGDTAVFKIATDASAYTINIYRMGYYGGSGARKIATITPSASLPQIQPACVVDPTTELTDCGNWAVSASWQIPANATSGIYFAHLIRSDTGGDSQIVFIVRNDNSHSQILFQTSDETWQAYNYYGTGSVYGPGQPQFDLSSRAYKVSYNRPFYTRNLYPESVTFVFGAEYAMVRWLEANGYDVTYFTGLDAARSGSLITNHQIYLSTGHDEYWSGPQRINVEAARDAGVNMAFFSGNEVFWKTRWENSIDGSNTSNRTLVCYKETLAFAKIDPQDPPTWTGTWRDPSFSPPADGGRPENSLTGTIFMVNGPGPDNDGSLKIQVPADDGKMRFWRNTAVASLAPNTTYMAPKGTLGYEWDTDQDNGSRPAGAFQLSTATYNLTTDYLLDFGATYGAGSATHHMMMYRAPSGALVFGAGTVQWSWGLDSNHDNPFGFVNPDPDVNMQQATLNLFADMGAQPGSIQTGLTAATASTDTTPPVSVLVSPAAGATVQTGGVVTVTGTATDAGGGVVGGVEVSVDGGQTWHPALGRETWSYSWTPNTVGSIALMSRAVDDSGNLENPQTSGGNPPNGVVVTVAPQTCPCTIWNAANAPTDVDSGDASSIEVGVKFRSDFDGYITGIRFYKATTNKGTHIGHLWTSSGTLLASATFVDESGSGWQQVQFSTAVPITANTVYIASYFAPSGHYSYDQNYFASRGYDDPPLHALATGVDGQNAVYVYGTAPAFPVNSYAASNYWVDAVFVEGSTVSISGTLSGMGGAGATVTLSGAANVATTADSSGNYNFGGLLNGSYTITPGNSGVTFSPPSQTVIANGASLSGVNFTATLTNPLSISGTISGQGGVGATVTLIGPSRTTTTADASGNYVFNQLLSGTYSVTPNIAGYIFTPGTQSVTLNATNVTGVNFTSQQCDCNTIWLPSATPNLVDSGDPTSVELGVRFRADFPGYITGLRFYKSSANTGTHIGHVWTNAGALLASATFTGETASGWQQVSFDMPVPVSPNTTYVASYFAPAGHYSADLNYFAGNGVDSPPLHALADGSDGSNGIYADTTNLTFPSYTFQSANYWVDVVYVVAPTYSISGTISGNGGAGATVTLSGAATATTTADAFGNYTFTGVLNGTYYVIPSNGAAIFTPGNQSVVVNGANVANVNFAVPSSCPCNTIWAPSTPPSLIDSDDGHPVEIGVRFRADSDGYIIGLRFYKSAPNTGTHIGNVWSNSGALLGTATFTNESPMGWQQVLFANPIPVAANTTYVASYFTPAGHYSADASYFATQGVDNAPLHALEDGVDGANGIFTYSATSVFPASTFQSDNYWVDVVFAGAQTYSISGKISGPGGPGATVNLSGATTSITTADGSGNYSFGGLENGGYVVTASNTGFIMTPSSQSVTINGAHALGVNFTSALPTYSISGTLGSSGAGTTVGLTGAATATATADSSGNYIFINLLNGSYTITPSSSSYVFTPSSQTVTVNAANVSAVNFSSILVTYSISGTITGAGGAGATVNLSGPVVMTTTADANGNYVFAALPGGTYTVTPSSSGYVFVPSGTRVVVSGSSLTGVNFSIPSTCPCDTIWSPASTPAVVDVGDGSSVEVGVKFRSDTAGLILGLRFYKSQLNTGTHIGNVWSRSGTLLGTATFTGETASGWQQVMFASPVAVSANTTYIASYFAPGGHWSVDSNYFAGQGFDSPPLHALSDGADGPDGVYAYSAASSFPTQTFASSNYWVDVVFSPQLPSYLNFGQVNVGTTAPVQTLVYVFTQAATLSAVNIVTQGVTNLDYRDGGSSTCAVGNSYNAGDECTVSVAFTPAAPGLRAGAVELYQSGSLLTTLYLTGVGESGGAVIDPGTQSTLATITGSALNGSAVDVLGNAYAVDSANGAVAEISAGSQARSTVVSGLNQPTAAAFDGAGNLFVSDTGNARVVQIPSVNGILNGAGLAAVSISGLGVPRGLAVDGTGNLYVADSANGTVLKVPSGGGSQVALASGLSNPYALAVDAAGDIYVSSDTGVAEYPAGGGGPVAIGSGYNEVHGLAVDASGTLFVADSGNARIVKIAAGGAQSSFPVAGLVSPQSVSLDAADNLYVADGSNLTEVTRNQGSPLIFGTQTTGTTSALQTLTVSNFGNQPFAINNVAITGPFSQQPSGGTDCSATGAVIAGANCEVAVAFAPTSAGAASGTLTVSETALNNPANSLPTVQLSGTGGQNGQTISFGALPSLTYGAAPFTLSASASSGLPVTFSVISGPATISGNTLTVTGAGTIVVEADQAGNSIYSAASPVQQFFAVSAATLLVTAGNAGMTYGATQPSYTYTISGFVHGDTIGVVGGAPSLSASPAGVGAYPIVTSQGTLAASNYTFTFANGTLTVTPATLIVTANSFSMAYGSAVPTLTYTIVGFVNSDPSTVVGGAPSLTTTATSHSLPGNYAIPAAKGTLSAANYIFSLLNGTVTVTPAALTVSANNLTSTYGGTIPTRTFTITGFVNGDTGSSVTGTPVLSTTGTSHSPAGTYPISITQGTLSSSKYSFVFVNGTLTINKAVLKVTANNASMTYGAALPTFTASYGGFVNGDTQSVLTGSPSLITTATSASPVGTYVITATQGTLAAANYTFSFANGTLTINKATLRINASNATMVYGGTLPTFSATYSGFVNGDTQSVLSGSPSLTTTATSHSAVGSYTITAAAGTLAAANYTLTFVNGTLTISKATITVTPSNVSMTYGGTLPAFSATYSGFVNGDTQSVLSGSPSLTTTATASSPVGVYVIASGTGTLAATNYKFAFANGKLTISKAVLTVTANSFTRPYGQANPSLTYTITGFVNGDTQSVLSGAPSLSTGAITTSHPGTFSIVVAQGTLAATNYSFTKVNGTLTVTKAATSISWSPSTTQLSQGTALGTGVLDATSVPSLAGSMVYKTLVNGVVTTVTSRTVLAVGTYTITATFTPSDSTDYTTATAQQTITITS